MLKLVYVGHWQQSALPSACINAGGQEVLWRPLAATKEKNQEQGEERNRNSDQASQCPLIQENSLHIAPMYYQLLKYKLFPHMYMAVNYISCSWTKCEDHGLGMGIQIIILSDMLHRSHCSHWTKVTNQCICKCAGENIG